MLVKENKVNLNTVKGKNQKNGKSVKDKTVMGKINIGQNQKIKTK